MSRNLNSVQLTGNLVDDPKFAVIGSNDTKVCEFRIAVNHGQDAAGEDRPASFLDVKTFGGNATSCRDYLAKGRKVAVHGELRQERWSGKVINADGEVVDGTRDRVRIVANYVEFLTPKNSTVSLSVNDEQGNPVELVPAVAEDEIPF